MNDTSSTKKELDQVNKNIEIQQQKILETTKEIDQSITSDITESEREVKINNINVEETRNSMSDGSTIINGSKALILLFAVMLIDALGLSLRLIDFGFPSNWSLTVGCSLGVLIALTAHSTSHFLKIVEGPAPANVHSKMLKILKWVSVCIVTATVWIQLDNTDLFTSGILATAISGGMYVIGLVSGYISTYSHPRFKEFEEKYDKAQHKLDGLKLQKKDKIALATEGFRKEMAYQNNERAILEARLAAFGHGSEGSD